MIEIVTAVFRRIINFHGDRPRESLIFQCFSGSVPTFVAKNLIIKYGKIPA